MIGVPNEEFGEEVKAVVQPLNWSEAGPELEAELIEFCRSQLSAIKCPRSVDFDKELPRHPTGKLYKRLVRDRYWGRVTQKSSDSKTTEALARARGISLSSDGNLTRDMFGEEFVDFMREVSQAEDSDFEFRSDKHARLTGRHFGRPSGG